MKCIGTVAVSAANLFVFFLYYKFRSNVFFFCANWFIYCLDVYEQLCSKESQMLHKAGGWWRNIENEEIEVEKCILLQDSQTANFVSRCVNE